MRNQDLARWCEEQMIQLVPIAGEAYWQMGKHSRHIYTLKQQMSKLATDLGNQVSNKEILALCVSAKNEMHQLRGYSPNQWAFGQNSDRIFSTLSCFQHLPNISSVNPSFHENISRMAKAREMFIQQDAIRRLERAATLKTRKEREYQPGDLVFYYRKGRGKGAKVRGQWHGPARVLFSEKTTKGDRGYCGSIIWISHGVVLLRCAPEHLQHVSGDLTMVDQEMNGPFSPDELLKGKHVYQDLFKEREEVEHDALGDTDTAWIHDPNKMMIEHDKTADEIPEEPMQRTRLNQKSEFPSDQIDRVAGQPSHDLARRSHEAHPKSPKDEERGDGSDGLHDGRARDDGSHGREDPCREDLRGTMGEGAELLQLGDRKQSPRRNVEEVQTLPETQDRGDGEGTGHPQGQGEGEEGSYHPIRSRRFRITRREWLEPSGRRPRD